jgi:transcriptional regulator with XRE-family HTH domain
MSIKNYRGKIKARNPKATEQVKADLAFQIAMEFERNRIASGFTQMQLADQIDTHQSSIARLESGGHLPSLRFLNKIAKVLGMYIELRLHKLSTTIQTHYVGSHAFVRSTNTLSTSWNYSSPTAH